MLFIEQSCSGNRFDISFSHRDILPGMFVRIRLIDLEMSSRFLGAEQDLSLLEADATLIGIAHGVKNIDL